MGLEPLLREAEGAGRPVLLVRPDPGSPARVALLAGSFDPITIGHAALAERAASRGGVVALVYAVRTLPKEGDAEHPLLEPAERLAVLERFCAARSGHLVAVASHGLLADQVVAAAERFPGAELSVVMGSDKALQLLDSKWYEDRDAALAMLFERADVLYADRIGEEGAVAAALRRPENGAWRGRFQRLELDPRLAAVSSRRVRRFVREGRDVAALVPEEARDAVRTAAARHAAGGATLEP